MKKDTMKTPVLSRNQQKKSISGLVKGKKENIKNILETPFSNYFPIINKTECSILLNEIKKLPKLSREKPNIPWVEMKDLSKEERKQLKNNHEINKDFDDNLVKFFRNNLCFGTNKVSSFLENQSILSTLITADVVPRFMVHHVVNLCVKYHIPVLVVPGLKDALRSSTGISSVTFGIRKTIKKDDEDADMEVGEIDGNIDVIKNLSNIINDIHKNYPVPKNHAFYSDNVDEKESSEESDMETDCETLIIRKKMHLKRGTPTSRAFIPPVTPRSIMMDVDSDFIIITDEEDKKPTQESKSNKKKFGNKKYQGLKVKRFKNNINRKKKT